MPRKRTPQERARLVTEARTLLAAGNSLGQTCRLLGQPFSTIRDLLIKACVPLPSRSPYTAEQATEQTRQCQARFLAGEPLHEIATALGVSRGTVSRRLRHAANPIPHPHGSTPVSTYRRTRQPRMTPQQRTALGEELRPQYDAGKSVDELAEEHGRSATLIYSVLRAVGTQMRRPGAPARGGVQ